MEKQEFITLIAPAARAHSSKILASLTIAQACLESNFGSSDLSTEGFNLFGIKGKGTAGSVKMLTHEWNGKQMVEVKADFAKYTSWEDSIADHLDLFLRLDRYANLIGESDFQRISYLVYKDGYATDPDYPAKLQAIYNQYDLGQYDKIDDCPDWAKGSRDLLKSYNVTDGERPNDPVTRAEVWTMLNRMWYAIEHKGE